MRNNGRPVHGGNMRSDKAGKLVDYGLEEVEKIAPNNSHIEVDVKEDPEGHYQSLIKVKAPHKLFFVKKEGDSMYESFHKALRALRGQISKKKINHKVARDVSYN